MTDGFYRLRRLSPRQIADVAVSELCARMHSLCSRIHEKIKREGKTDRAVILNNIVRHSALKLSRITRDVVDDKETTDILAWTARWLFEVNLIARRIIASDEDLKKFKAQILSDERHFLEGILTFKPYEKDPEAADVLKNRIAAIERNAHELDFNLESARPAKIKRLAENEGVEYEYDAMYRISSKYIHPSAWYINRDSDEVNGNVYRRLLLERAVLYAGDTLRQVSVALGISDSNHQ